MKKALPEILSRITIGAVFVESGWGKLHNLPKIIEFFESLNIPFAHLQAPFVSGVELIAGLFVFLGLFTRLASVPLIAIMVVAIITAKREEITDLTSIFGFSEFLYIVILVWLVAYGSEALSLGRAICNPKKCGSCKKD